MKKKKRLNEHVLLSLTLTLTHLVEVAANAYTHLYIIRVHKLLHRWREIQV